MTQLIGQNYKKKIKEIVEERLGAIGVATYANKYNGEVDTARLSEFLKIKDQLREELFRKLDVYKNYATNLRQENNMRPFSWALETVDRIEQYAHVDRWQLPKLRTFEDAEPSEALTRGKQHAKETFTISKKKSRGKWQKPSVRKSVKYSQIESR